MTTLTATHSTVKPTNGTAAHTLLAAGLELARVEITPDRHPDEAPVLDGPTAEDLADYGHWADESTARDHLDASERLTLAELVDRQAAFYRGWNNAAGEMMARAMDELALKVRLTDATTPDEFEARVEILDHHVEVHLLRGRLGRPDRLGVPLDRLERDALLLPAADLGPVLLE